PEDMVAGELGISRTPIRDALRRLQVEQLITVTPYSGARVASWSERDLDEVAHMRAMLEGYAAALACAKRTAGQIAAMEAVCDRMDAEGARPGADVERLGAGNLGSHRAVVEAADSARRAACLGPMWSLPVAVRKFGLYSRARMMRSLSDHREVVRAIT